jgi:putative hemolysin
MAGGQAREAVEDAGVEVSLCVLPASQWRRTIIVDHVSGVARLRHRV